MSLSLSFSLSFIVNAIYERKSIKKSFFFINFFSSSNLISRLEFFYQWSYSLQILIVKLYCEIIRNKSILINCFWGLHFSCLFLAVCTYFLCICHMDTIFLCHICFIIIRAKLYFYCKLKLNTLHKWCVEHIFYLLLFYIINNSLSYFLLY